MSLPEMTGFFLPFQPFFSFSIFVSVFMTSGTGVNRNNESNPPVSLQFN